VVVVEVPERFGTGSPGDGSWVCVTVVGGSGPKPSGSTTVVAVDGPLVVGLVVADGLVVSVSVVSGVVLVVVGVL
jgi:hypothetical protein